MKKLIFIFLVLSLLIASFFSLFSFNKIAGMSMEPSIKTGSNVIFFKWNRNPQRGDIVLYAPKDQNKSDDPRAISFDYIGRVVGLPTESVRVENGNLYLDNNVEKYRVEEEYLSPGTMTMIGGESEWHKIGEFEYFVLTDRRDDYISIPGRIVPRDNIKGVLLFRF